MSPKKLQFIESGSPTGVMFVIIAQKIHVARDYKRNEASEHVTFINSTYSISNWTYQGKLKLLRLI